MILADTSVWIDHLKAGDTELVDALRAGSIATHPFVIGEIALGTLRQRSKVLSDLENLPHVTVATNEEARALIEDRKLSGRGIGFVDVHLIASVLLSPGTSLWTRDRRLKAVAADLGTADRRR